ncbi:uncharacterized protein J8A68_003292 [[Candida] subhashii]|uniref:Major facilitator superfamily (MFS) profile domain-containing protein n=1 Tax=[Candida] subhashii TaxID=561895 RepID=A0A8J5QMM3_9ASCO|nr:uncharacterized protein J8A68_003292 [[Candida] subhashii]KAG7663210.1 hypothetical protein J8A68_003292 [[Candida] subhashii]
MTSNTDVYFSPLDTGSNSDSTEFTDSLPLPESQHIDTPPNKYSTNDNTQYNVEFEGEILVIDSTNWRHSNLLKAQILSGYLIFTLFGLAEQTVGTLIPILQSHYKINDLEISLIFLFGVSGYLTMALINNLSHELVGIKGVGVLGSICMTVAYLTMSTKPHYGIFLICSLGNGIGLGALDAAFNTWMGNLVDSNQLMGILHGCYGLGSMISPTLITYLLEKKHNPWNWNDYYVVLSILGGMAIVMMITTFKYETPKKYKYVTQLRNQRAKNNEIELDHIKSTTTQFEIDELESQEYDEPSSATLGMTLRSKLVWLLSSILFIYVGAEVSFGAWLVTYLLRIRSWTYKHSSYMATTFWSGLTLGRMALGFVTAHYFKDELTANFTYILSSLLGYIIFWLFAHTSLNFILFIIVFATGIVVGPIFPTTIVASVNILPAKYQTSGIGFICAFGGGGAAGVPFLIGLVAQSSDFGLRIMPLIIIILFSVLSLMWFVVIRTHSKTYKRNTI